MRAKENEKREKRERAEVNDREKRERAEVNDRESER